MLRRSEVHYLLAEVEMEIPTDNFSSVSSDPQGIVDGHGAGEESCEAIMDFEGSGVSVVACRYLPIVGSRHRRGKTRTQTNRGFGKIRRAARAT